MSPEFTIKLVAINARYTHSSLALFYVRHQLEKFLPDAGIEIYQFSINEPYYEMVLDLTADNPDAIFISSAIWNSSIVERMIVDIKNCLPQCQVVVGGPQVEVVADKCSNYCTAIVGEIEGINPEFYDDLITNRLQKTYKGNFKAVLKDGLPAVYRRADFPVYLENRHVYYESSRGCPFSCTYCLSSAENGVYHKDLQQVKDELTLILSHKPKVLRFIDRTYNDNWRRGLEIWEFLMDHDVDTLFHFEIAPDFFTEEMFSFLETVPSGRFQFEIGIQSTYEKTLDAICRKIDPTRVHEIVSRLAGFDNIHLHVDLILGLPFETRETFLRSFEEVFAMNPHYIQMGLLKMLPDTKIRKEAVSYGYIYSKVAPYSVFANKWLDHGELSKLYWFCECVEKFLNNRFFTSLWKYFRAEKEPIAQVFLGLLEVGQQEKIFEYAPTQEFLSKIIIKWAANRKDHCLIRDLVRYDWLRCGHRQLPECLELADQEESFKDTRNRLYEVLPEEKKGVYDIRSRNRFFKKCTFWCPDSAVLSVVSDGSLFDISVLCVFSERVENLQRYNKIMFL